MRLILVILLLCAGTAQGGDLPGEVRFSDLADPAAREFDDPFQDMGPERLNDLKTVLRLEERLTEQDLDGGTRQRLEVLQIDARDRLAAHGHDIEALLAQRWIVARNRERARFATNPALEGAEVTLSGYLIPAGTDEDGLAIGYLFPVVGTCSHTPAPPPNELVRLHFDPAQATRSIYLPVRVSGTLRAEPSDETILLLDGEVRMTSSWRLDAQAVVRKGAVEGEANAHASHDPPSGPAATEPGSRLNRSVDAM